VRHVKTQQLKTSPRPVLALSFLHHFMLRNVVRGTQLSPLHTDWDAPSKLHSTTSCRRSASLAADMAWLHHDSIATAALMT
jgi:hypothetical protein